MTKNQPEQTKQSVAVAVAAPTLGQRMAQWIEDPFASAMMATAATFTAVVVVLSSMWVISALIS